MKNIIKILLLVIISILLIGIFLNTINLSKPTDDEIKKAKKELLND